MSTDRKLTLVVPDALLTFELYDCFIAIHQVKDEKVRIEKLRALLRMLPDTNATLVEYMLDFLARVSRHSKSNKMTVSNLATIFGPIFLRSSQIFDELISETSIVCGVLIELLEKRAILFGDPK